MNKHTKGPWKSEGLTIYSLQHGGWSRGEEQLVNRFTAHVQGAMNCPREEADANARLIAAAPELLEVLETIENDNGQVPEWLWLRIQEVVAKAKNQ